MSVADSGGFDIAIELNRTAILAAIASGATIPVSTRPFTLPNVSGTITPSVRVTNLAMASNDDITITLTIDGTVLTVTSQSIFPIPGGGSLPPELSRVDVGGTVAVTDRLEIRGTSLVADFSDDAARGQPAVVPALDEAKVLASPLVTLYLASRLLSGGLAAYTQAKQELLTQIRDGVRDAVHDAVVALGTVTLVPAPSTPPIVVSAAALRTRAESLHLLYTVGGTPGNPASITRSMLLTSTSTGLPLDAAALCLSNAFLLRDVLRPAATGFFGLPAGGFLAGHPCWFIGAAPFTPPGGLPTGVASMTVDSLIGGTDEASRMHVIIGFTVNGFGGAFTYKATVDVTIALGVTAAAGAITFTVTPTVAVTSSDVEIPAWVYIASALSGNALLLTILLEIDVVAGTLIAGPLATALGGLLPAVAFPLPLPARVPPLAPRQPPNLNQPDAPTRIATLTISGIPLPLPDPFRAHDFITNYV
jgi:hypothetical protein